MECEESVHQDESVGTEASQNVPLFYKYYKAFHAKIELMILYVTSVEYETTTVTNLDVFIKIDESLPLNQLNLNELHEEENLSMSVDFNNTNNENLTSEDLINNSTWKLGQLSWARMSIYPFWPCMITYDPNALMSYQKVQTVGRSKTLMIHVHFFNDHGRHSWIPAHHMIPFKGIEDFRKRASLVTDIIRKKEPKFAAALTIKPNVFGTWQKAVAEAMDVLYELDMTPLDNFKTQPKDITKSVSKTNVTTKKRKRKSDDNQHVKKMFKPNDSNSEGSVSVNSEATNNLNLETPPVSPPNEEDLRAATIQKQKRITKMINKLQPPDFEVYFERNFITIKDQHSDTTDEQVREYLLGVWESMAPEEKLKYRSTYKIDGDR